MKKNIFIAFILLVCASNIVRAQSEDKLQKTIDLYDSDPEKATKKLKKLIDKAGSEATYDAWDIYVEMKETTYNSKLASIQESFQYHVIQVQYVAMQASIDSLIRTATPENDAIHEKYAYRIRADMDALDASAYAMYSGYYDDYIYSMREASLKSKSIRSDGNLRTIFLTIDPDTMSVDSIDIAHYNNAYEELNQGHLEESKVLLNDLIVKYPKSYNINMSMYLYYTYKEQLDSAKIFLNKVIMMYPKKIEPRENLAKILFGEGNIYRARKQTEELMVLFPGQDMKGYYNEVLFVEDKKMVEKRLLRPVFPNQMGVTYPIEKSHWGDYQEAKFKVASFTESTGIIKTNDITKEKYLELYSWKKMLDKNRDNKPEELLFAYEMEEKGLLDCYVFFSNFHIDFAIQAKDFSASEENRERMKKFVRDYLVDLAE